MGSIVEDFLTATEEAAIVEAIRKAELLTSGEIRVHLERHSELPALDRAKELFHLLKMDNTKEENGVLIYLGVDDHQLAIIGDRGLNTQVPKDFWQTTIDKMLAQFQKGRFCEGIIAGVQCAGEKLALYFPWQHDDTNELPNEISTS